MTGRFVAALDQGTTSTRCMVFDGHGRMVSIAQREHHQYFPRPGWVEHDAAEIWSIVRRVVPQAIADAGIEPRQIVALGVTNQRETTVLWDRHTGIPVSRAIVWQDTRTAPQLAQLSPDAAAMITARTGLPMATYFSAPKLRWLLDRDSGCGRARRSGRCAVRDHGQLDLLEPHGWRGRRRPGARTARHRRHQCQPDHADGPRDPGLGAGSVGAVRGAAGDDARDQGDDRPVGVTVDPVPGIEIGAIIGDQQASLLGQTAFDAGDAKCTFGTGSFLLLNTGSEIVRSQHGLITTVAHKFTGEPAVYALEGSVAVAGGLVQWCRDSLGLIRTPAEIETLAAEVEDNGGCYVVPAFSGLFAPYWDSAAQGVLVGLTSYVTKSHIARAVLEATAWQTRDVVDAMNADAGVPAVSLAVDGGMTADNLLMQMISDALDIPVVRPMMAETVALGAAYAAGLAVGHWPDRQLLRRHWQRAAEWRPAIDPARRDNELAAWRHAVSLARAWGARPSSP